MIGKQAHRHRPGHVLLPLGLMAFRFPATYMGGMEPQASSATEWTVRDNREQRRFEIDLGDGSLAIAEYTLPEATIMFSHTEVPSKHEGKGIGTALIKAGLSAARERGLKVIPICPFFAAYIKQHEEEHDLVDPTWRGQLGLS